MAGRERIGSVGLFVIVLALVAKTVYDHLYTRLPLHIDGHVEPKFEDVKAVFMKNFLDGWEKDGASFTVYRDGKKVVDLWGGYADRTAARKWLEVFDILYSQGQLPEHNSSHFLNNKSCCWALRCSACGSRYNDLVIKHWPGFGKNGKDNVTVQMALSHMAGIAYIDEPITEEHVTNHEMMRVLIENEKPKWPPGTETGYHVFTYGWLVDQIVRHADEKHRSIGTFFREEFAEKYDIDFHIGLPAEEEWRVARLSENTLLDGLSELATDWRTIRYFLLMRKFFEDSIIKRVTLNPTWLFKFNNVDYHRFEQAAAFGIGNARSLAKLFDLVASGKLFSKKTNEQLQQWYVNKTDIAIDEHVAKGNGFFYMPLDRAGTKYAIGHPGNGCQQVQYDVKNKLTIAYTTNGLKMGLVDLCRTYAKLQNAVYNVIEKE